MKNHYQIIQKGQAGIVGRVILLFFFLATISSCRLESKQPQSIVALAERIQNGLSEHFIFELTENSNEQFEINSKGKKIVIRGSTLNSITTGLGWYLKYYCNSGTFWSVKRNPIPIPLPKVEGKIVHQTSMKHRYYFNYTCDRYSYRYWDWTRWEEEIDWMALNGINMALTVIDRGAVLWKTCESYGVRETANRYLGDGLMPFTQFHYQLHEYEMSQRDNRIRLQQAVIARMREMGIEPVLDGYKGIVPKQLTETVSNAKFNDGGMWGTISKEPVIDITDPFFEEFGTKYYHIQKELYGDQLFIDADYIIEGTGPKNTDLGELGLKIQSLILNSYPNAIWVVQAWEGKPNEDIFKKTNPQRTLILDLACEISPEWRKKDFFHHNPWVWGIINNFGGRTGIYGNLENIFDQQAELKSLPQGKFLCGVGALMEAIENNPVVYNALFESAWMDTKPDMHLWLQNYVKGRYGKQNEHAEKAWNILHKIIYSATRYQQGSTENLMCAWPKLKINNVSRYSTTTPYYNKKDIVTAWDEMLSAADELGGSDGYQLDLVELTREIISNCAFELYPKVIAAYQEGNQIMFDRLSKQFLDLFDDMELILSTRKETMIATWIDIHRSWGQNELEKNYFEKVAKSIITIYSDIPTLANRLHDYAHREWSGIMKDLYKARFEKYFSELRGTTNNNIEPQIDWFEFDKKWTITPSNYSTRVSCCPVDACKAIHNKYRSHI